MDKGGNGTGADIAAQWRDDLVPFAIGCSLTFEADLVAAGVAALPHAGVSCSAFDTNLPNTPPGRSAAIWCRAGGPEASLLAVAVTKAHPDAHGAPVRRPRHHRRGPVAPDRRLGLTDIRPGEVPSSGLAA